jgi:hypothetical protein
LATELKRGKYRSRNILITIFGWCKDRKIMKNLRFMRLKIEASLEIVTPIVVSPRSSGKLRQYGQRILLEGFNPYPANVEYMVS